MGLPFKFPKSRRNITTVQIYENAEHYYTYRCAFMIQLKIIILLTTYIINLYNFIVKIFIPPQWRGEKGVKSKNYSFFL